jgi:hypothetical protein
MKKFLEVTEGILGLIVVITIIFSLIVLCPVSTAIIVSCGLLILILDAVKLRLDSNESQDVL